MLSIVEVCGMRRNVQALNGDRPARSFHVDERHNNAKKTFRKIVSSGSLDANNRPVIREMLEAGRADIQRVLNSDPVKREIIGEVKRFRNTADIAN